MYLVRFFSFIVHTQVHPLLCEKQSITEDSTTLLGSGSEWLKDQALLPTVQCSSFIFKEIIEIEKREKKSVSRLSTFIHLDKYLEVARGTYGIKFIKA